MRTAEDRLKQWMRYGNLLAELSQLTRYFVSFRQSALKVIVCSVPPDAYVMRNPIDQLSEVFKWYCFPIKSQHISYGFHFTPATLPNPKCKCDSSMVIVELLVNRRLSVARNAGVCLITIIGIKCDLLPKTHWWRAQIKSIVEDHM